MDEADGSRSAPRLVVLDDDPTGTQTVRAVPVLTAWEPDDLRWALEQGGAGFFVLTNTRSLHADAAAARTEQVVERVLDAAGEAGVEVAFVSRSDSTLRGWFPLETDVIRSVLARRGRPVDGILLVPADIDAGRITRGGVHLVRTADGELPVGESEFARDTAFGYRASRLDAWVEEKTAGRVPASDVASVPLEVVRHDAARLRAVLGGLRDGRVVAPDAVTDDDLRAVAAAARDVEAAGVRLLHRTGPSFVRALLGQVAAPPIDDPTLAGLVGPGHGLVVVGSHVGLTTAQLARLVAEAHPAVVELAVDEVIDGDAGVAAARAADAVVAGLADGTTVLTTSRRRRDGRDGEEGLRIGRAVSAAVVDAVRRIVAVRRPGFVVAKGGITSSDVATEALGIRRAVVRGSLLPGIVSLWQAVDGPAAGLPYAVFAGNVGDEAALTRVVERLAG